MYATTHDGQLRIVDADGIAVEQNLRTDVYQEYIGETVEPWTDVTAEEGGDSPQSSSTSRSTETTSPFASSSSASTLRCFGPPSVRTVSPSRTSSGPRTRNSNFLPRSRI